MRRYLLLLSTGLLVLLAGCDENDNVNFLSPEQDVALGQQVDSTIRANPNDFPILDEAQHPDAYAYLRTLRDEVLASDAVTYRQEFAWEIAIIEDDSTLNAFATPGGYMYFYTGLIKYLDTKDQLAGVMGHELAHADLRHSSREITRQQGFSFLVSLIAGEEPGALTQVANSLISLRYSRNFETEADERSVEYLSDTPYQCDGAAGFFIKLEQAGASSGVPTFLSTHPSPDDRVQNIGEKATEVGCDTSPSNDPTYDDFKRMLP